MILLTAEESMERMFGLDWQLLADSCLTLIAMFALFFVMSYFLFNPVRKMMNERKEKIKEELDSAKKAMEDADKMKAEYEAKLKNADSEVEGILGDARKRALANENKIVSEAHEEAGRIMDKARTEAVLEKQKMADEVKTEMITIASAIAGKVVAASIDTTVQDELVEETLKEMGDSTWQN